MRPPRTEAEARQRLLALSYDLRRALSEAGDELASILHACVDEVQAALDELRELAHGIHPAILTEAGLAVALRTLADTAPVPLDVVSCTDERFPAVTEATAYAVARHPIGCWVEALAMFGLQDGVPVAGYGPRGSAEAIAAIRAAVTPGVPAVLLANHGVLVFHRTPDLAILVGGVVEEAAQASINAAALGGPVEIPPDLRAAALQRAMTFDSQGTVRA